MQKVKLNFSGFFSLIKCSLLGIVFTLLGTVVLAIVLRFVDLSPNVVDYINNAIKGLSIFFMLICVKKTNNDKFMIRAIITGIMYAVLSFVIFSLLNRGFAFDLSVLSDLLFAMIVAIISSVIINLMAKKRV